MQVLLGICLLFAFVDISYEQSRESVLGVICGKHCGVSKQTVILNFRCVSVVYHRVDMANDFDVFKTVHQLDSNESVDVIVILDNTTITSKERILLHAYNKKLIIWGDVRHKQNLPKIKFAALVKPRYCKIRTLQTPQLQDESAVCETKIITRSRSDIVGRTLYNGPMVLTSLMEHLKWKYVIVIYEDATLFEMSGLVDQMSKHGIFCSLYHIDDLDKMSVDLTMKKNLHYFTFQVEASVHFLVLCRIECTKRVLKEANEFDDKNNRNQTALWGLSRWLLALYGSSHDILKKFRHKMDNVLVIPVPEVHLHKQDFQLFLQTIKKIQNERIHSSCLGLESVSQKIAEISSEVGIPCDNYHITTLTWTSKGREFSEVGYIQHDGEVFIANELFPNVKYGYNKRYFHVSVIVYPPFVIRRTTNGTAHFAGFCIHILEELARVLNFTVRNTPFTYMSRYHITEVPDGNYGMLIDRKTMKFNGLIGQVQRNEVDMIVGDIAISRDREEVMDFTYPFHYGYTTVIFKRQNSDRYKWRKLADPFTWQVIVSVLVTLLLASLIIAVIERTNPYYTTTLNSDTNTHNCRRYMCGLQSFSGSISYLFVILFNEGYPSQHEPRSFAGRTFFSFWCLFGLVISGTYCGNLIASLTVTKEVKPFDSLNEMVQMSGDYKWGTIGGSLWEETSDIPSFKGIGDGIRRFNKSDPDVLNKNSGYHMQRVKTEDNYAYIADDGSIGIAMTKDCRLTKIKERFLMLTEAFGFPNKSPHVKIFAEKLKHMQDSGLIKQWKRLWWRSSKTCQSTMKTEAKPVEIQDVQGAFYIAAGGILFSLFAFGIELIIARLCRVKSDGNR